MKICSRRIFLKALCKKAQGFLFCLKMCLGAARRRAGTLLYSGGTFLPAGAGDTPRISSAKSRSSAFPPLDSRGGKWYNIDNKTFLGGTEK